MCGLFGFVGKIGNPGQRLSLATSLALFNEERGDHSTGIALVDRDTPRPYLLKYVAPAKRVVGRTAWVQALLRPRYDVLIGHTRWASVGQINKANAHPFHVGKTVGAHNGTITNVADLAKSTGADYGTDSQHLIHLLDRDNHLGSLRGWAALTFTQLKAAADVSLMRWNAPLFAAELPEHMGLVWSSEKDDLEVALRHAGLHRGAVDFDIPDDIRVDVFLDNKGRLSDFGFHPAPLVELPYLPRTKAKASGNITVSTNAKPLGKAWDTEDVWSLPYDGYDPADPLNAEYAEMVRDGVFETDADVESDVASHYGLDLADADHPIYLEDTRLE